MLNDLFTLAMGAWGDVFLSLIALQRFQKRFSFNEIDIIHYGFDPEISKFLAYQKYVRTVTHVKPKDYEQFSKIMSSSYLDDLDWVKELGGNGTVIPTHVRYSLMRPELIFRELDYVLPDIEYDIPKRSILLNPVSFHSNAFSEHSPVIPEAMEFLIKESDWNFVLVGQEKTQHCIQGEYWDYPFQIDMPNVLNLVGKTKSMAEVLAIAELCDGIITTSNCLSMWSILSKKPTIVWLNSKMTSPYALLHNYYKEWISSKPNHLVRYDDSLGNFIKVYEEWNKGF